MGIGTSSPSRSSYSRLTTYDEHSQELTPPFGTDTARRLRNLCRFSPTREDLEQGNIQALEAERQRLRVDLMSLFSTIPFHGKTKPISDQLRLIRSRLAKALVETFVEEGGDHLTLDPNEPNNIYHRLTRAHEHMNDAMGLLGGFFEEN